MANKGSDISKTAILIGAGNVATHLGKSLADNGIKILQVYSKTKTSSHHLANILNTEGISAFGKISSEADFYIIAVKDGLIAEIAERLPETNGIVLHTSGSISMDALKSHNNYGVLYPLQTFSKAKPGIAFSKIPILIEAKNPETLLETKKLASLLSSRVEQVSSPDRLRIHLAAVFACNFTNYMYQVAETILKEKGLDFSLLLPLIEETLEKVKMVSPAEAQTGPAVRGDNKTMEAHLALLKETPEHHSLYELLSGLIIENKKKNNTFAPNHQQWN
jgi:predicted short-subunit dehydrogenase-like oxidoreductase (DUF2520 family)